MTNNAKNPDDYSEKVPDERRKYFKMLRETIKQNLPEGFEECMSYGMIGYVVPHSKYPSGYHCDPKQALPFMSIASQKNFITFYHSGIYAIPEIHDWFVSEYPNFSKRKLDMGKGCLRFKKPEDIPFELIAKLIRKLTVDDWIKIYEANIKGE